jgi:hypothetical protein
MTRLVLDAATRARLHNLDSLVEVCDESGQLLGYFHPVAPGLSSAPPRRSPFTDDELQKRRQQRAGRPLREILDRLGGS